MLRDKHLKFLFNQISTNSRRDETEKEKLRQYLAKQGYQVNQSLSCVIVLYQGPRKTAELEISQPSHRVKFSLTHYNIHQPELIVPLLILIENNIMLDLTTLQFYI